LANIKSQIKRNRQNERRRLRNRVFRGEARIAVRDARTAIEAGDAEQSRTAVMQAIRNLDLAVQQGVLHRNNAARRKSRLMHSLAVMKPKEVKAKVEPTPETGVAVDEPKETRKAARTAKPAKTTKAAKPAAKEAKAETEAPKKPAKKAAEKKTAEKKTAEKKPAEASKAKKPAAKKTSAKKE